MAIEPVKEPEHPSAIVVMFAIALPLAIIFGPTPSPWYYWLLAVMSWFCVGKWVYDKLTFTPFK